MKLNGILALTVLLVPMVVHAVDYQAFARPVESSKTQKVCGWTTGSPCDHTSTLIGSKWYTVSIYGFGTNTGGTSLLYMCVPGDTAAHQSFASCTVLGFAYIYDGTCHQYSNRTLSRPGFTVAAAKGYGLTTAMFGVYGSGGYSKYLACKTLNPAAFKQ